MSERVLVADDDPDILTVVKINFELDGFEVETAVDGEDALQKATSNPPNAIVLDIMMPRMDGLTALHRLRSQATTANIPIILLTARGLPEDRVRGLELGADDYITKPFDIEELKLRVKNQIDRAARDNYTDPNSGLPSSSLIEEKLRDLIRENTVWSYLDIRVLDYDAFKDVYGFVAANELLRFMALLLGEMLDELGTPNDFLGHAGSDNFVVITYSERVPALVERLTKRFAEGVQQHYSFIDRERGYLLRDDERVPLMSLAVGVISNATRQFADIREITELAAENRRRGRAEDDEPVAAEW